MRILGITGRENLALVYLAELDKGKLIEFVESLQPPLVREEKWVLIVSSLFGCPVRCKMCDAGGDYRGKLKAEEILFQIEYMVKKRFPDGKIPVRKFKIQFARMGEPSYNPAVLEVLEELPKRYKAPGLLPCISTIAPSGKEKFFEKLLRIKNTYYTNGKFQLQFSIHSTEDKVRDDLIPVKKWTLGEIADYARSFYRPGDRKITLNFAYTNGLPVDPDMLLKYFSPEKFFIKITPLNPTYQATRNKLKPVTELKGWGAFQLAEKLRRSGYEVLISVGELEENRIGSNCGQYVIRHLKEKEKIRESYTYKIKQL